MNLLQQGIWFRKRGKRDQHTDAGWQQACITSSDGRGLHLEYGRRDGVPAWRRALLLVVFYDVRAAHFGFVRILAELAAGTALA